MDGILSKIVSKLMYILRKYIWVVYHSNYSLGTYIMICIDDIHA